jgi:hypothetical protein
MSHLRPPAVEDPVKRPRGITIVAVILAVLGIFSVLFGALFVILAITGNGQAGIEADQVLLVEGVGITYLVIGLAQLCVAWALWRLKRAAWWLTVILQGISVLQALAAMAFTDVRSIDLAMLPGLIVSLAILGYFLTKGVRAGFGYGPVFGE